MKKNSVLVVFGVSLLLVIGFFVYQKGTKQQSNSQPSNHLVYTVQQGSIESTISAVGQVQSTDTREIKALSGSTVKQVACKENQVVRKGDILFVLTNESADLDLERANLTLSQQQNQLKTLINQQKDLIFRAPVAGIVRNIAVVVGDLVNPPYGMPGTSSLIQLEDTSVMKFTIFASPADSGKNMKGMMPGNQKISVNFQGQGIRECVVSSANVTSQGSSVTFQVLKPDGLVFGQFYTISIPVMMGIEIPVTSPVQVVGNTVMMNAKQSAMVTKVNIKVGDLVVAGQELMVTTSDSLTSQIQMATLSVKSAELSVKQQQKQVQDLVVRAPIDGVVYQILIQEGSIIGSSSSQDTAQSPVPSSLSGLLKNQGTSSPSLSIPAGSMSGGHTIATIESQTSRKVSITIDELDISKIKVNQPAKITLDAFSDKVFNGYVSSLSSIGIVQNGSATFKADVLIESTEKMMTGMSATVSIMTESKEKVLLLPIDAIFSKNSRRYVIIMTEKGLVEKDIQVGMVNEDYAEIREGLKEGDTVVLPVQDSNLFDKPGTPNGSSSGFPMMQGGSNHASPFNQP